MKQAGTATDSLDDSLGGQDSVALDIDVIPRFCPQRIRVDLNIGRAHWRRDEFIMLEEP
jgi:hypothetical protein